MRKDYILLSLSSMIGLMISTLPHWWTGNPAWMADYDDFAFYRPLGVINSSFNGFQLQDPATGRSSYYQSVPVRPALVIIKVFNLPFDWVGLIWRALGGVGIGLVWYLFFRLRLQPYYAFCVTLLMMTDAGMLQGQIGYVTVRKITAPLNPLQALPAASLPQWRIHNPVVSWTYWIGFLILVGRAVQCPNRTRCLHAGIAFGLLFYVYFYYWTAAALGLGICVICLRASRGLFMRILLLGLLIGMPSIISSSLFKAQHGTDWMHRTDKFLPVDRFSELLIPKLTFAIWLTCTIVVWRMASTWRWLSLFSLACLLLLNQTVVSGLMVENFHWNYALGPVICGLIVMSLSELVHFIPSKWQIVSQLTLVIITLFTAISGIVLCTRAIDGCRQPREIAKAVESYRALSSQLQPVPGLAVAGIDKYQYAASNQHALRPLAGYSAVLSPISDLELNRRAALNAWLLGNSREEFLAQQKRTYDSAVWGYEARSAKAKELRLNDLGKAWNEIVTDPTYWQNSFGVKLVILPITASNEHLKGWKLVGEHEECRLFMKPEGISDID